MTKPLIFSAFVENCAGHIIQGLWREPDARNHEFNSVKHWIDLAKTLENGGFDFLFFADVIGLYGDYDGSYRKFVETGLQIPVNDPSSIASAIAYATESIGIAITSSVLQEHPFNFARRMSTLDHATEGRVAWNIVTNSLENGARNFGQALTPHDERYRWADEYVDVVYKLWEGSWDEGALVQDKEAGIHADFERVHKIHHVGERYQVEGPHLVSPSPQRTPLLFQAGSSSAGRQFAAHNAELQFIVTPSPDVARTLVNETDELVVAAGREHGALKYVQGLSFVIGSTEEEARRREADLEEKIDIAAMVAHLGGAIGVDFGGVPLDTPLGQLPDVEGTRSVLEWARQSVSGREATVEDLGRLQGRATRLVGTPESIADQLARWSDAGVDGVNVIPATRPGGFVEFIEHVMPVLRERGLARPEPLRDATARARVFGTDRLAESHPAAAYRGAFAQERVAELV